MHKRGPAVLFASIDNDKILKHFGYMTVIRAIGQKYPVVLLTA